MRASLALFAAVALASCGGPGASALAGGVASTPPIPAPHDALAAIRAAARPISGFDEDYADILASAGPARRVLLGESTHGTEEYYRVRARISDRLATGHGVQAIAIEADWTPTWRVNLYVRGLGSDRSVDDALGGYTRFPQWMWRNSAFRDFVERLRAINLGRPPEQRVGLYGMDVYDLYDAADFVVAELRRTDRPAAGRVARHYHCFARYNRDAELYGAATRNRARSCRDEAEAAVAEVGRLARPSGVEAAERHFALLRSAASVAAAEAFFRSFHAGSMSWNVRDRAMERNVEGIAAHGEALSGRPGKVVVWAHNSHLGDARATSAADRGQVNLGQLMRERHGDRAFLVGLFSASGTVFAAPAWGAAGRVYTMRPPLAGSHEALFDAVGLTAFSLILRGNAELDRTLGAPALQRAIGVIYLPQTERPSHYSTARLAHQFDAAIFFSQSQSVTPLRR